MPDSKISSRILSAAGPLIGLTAVCVLFAVLRFDTFVSRDNFAIILQQTGVIGAAALCGAFSGLLITRLRLLPFVVTLGMMGALRGAAKGLANEQPIYPDETWLNGLLRLGRHGGLPAGIWLVVVLAILVALAPRSTRFGRHVFAIGS